MLPEHVSSYLQSVYENKDRAMCFLVDSDYCLQAAWGPVKGTLFADLSVGDSMLDLAPFLIGSLNDAIEHIPFVSMRSGTVYEVHTLPYNEQHFVVLLNANHDHDLLQTKQQTANELKLLHDSQAKLINRQRELINDLVEAKSELDHRHREAELNNTKKNEFIAMMSHEFRTPLASIINYADLALEESTDKSEYKKCSEAIARAARHLKTLVETVLDDAQEASKSRKAQNVVFNIYALADDMATLMAPLAAEKGLAFAAHLEQSVPHKLLGDPLFLRQILINLLGNAIKYTEHGSVKLYVSWSLGCLEAKVVDTGPGISPEDKETIFKAFQRGSSQLNKPGAGLGLAIAADLAKQMNGSLELDSQYKSGCAIRLSVPAAVSKSEPKRSSNARLQSLDSLKATHNYSVLVCDDDEDMIALIEHYLLRAGYGVLLASNGVEAVEKAITCIPDVVLMDICTPKMNGLDAVKALSKAGFTKPIIAMTAMDMKKDESDQFTGFLRKPFQIEELLTLLKNYLDNI